MRKRESLAFQKIPVPERQGKPRERGMTMMIDWGLNLGTQIDCLEAGGAFIDEAKIAAGISRLMPLDYLRKKTAAYEAEGILAFPGGLFAELAIAQGNFEAFLQGAREAGFSAVEISDNLLEIPPDRKRAVISKAAKSGFKVMGEVGKKEGSVSPEEMIADIEGCLEAGALKVLLEAHELFSGEIKKDVIDAVTSKVPLDRIIFELPVLVLPGSSRDLKHRVLAWLVKEFGTEVNLANVEWDEVFITELVRRGMAGDTSHPQGAYRLAGFR